MLLSPKLICTQLFGICMNSRKTKINEMPHEIKNKSWKKQQQQQSRFEHSHKHQTQWIKPKSFLTHTCMVPLIVVITIIASICKSIDNMKLSKFCFYLWFCVLSLRCAHSSLQCKTKEKDDSVLKEKHKQKKNLCYKNSVGIESMHVLFYSSILFNPLT